MPSIRKRNGRYRAEVKRTFAGATGPVQRRWSQTFNTLAAARHWALEVEDLLDQGGDPDAPDPRAPAPTVREWHARWWAARVAEKTTLATNESRLRVHVLPRWGPVPVDAIKPLDVQQWVKQLEKAGLAPATVSSCHQLLRRMLAAAMVEGLRPDDPCVHTRLPTIPKGHGTYWTREQVDAIVAAIPAQRDKLVVLTLAYTGLRWGELCGLRVGALDLLRRRLRVERVETRHGPKEYPKSGAGRRTVPLPVWLCEALAAYLARSSDATPTPPQGLSADHPAACATSHSTTAKHEASQLPLNRSALVFANERGRPLSGHNFRNRVWVDALKAAEVPPGRIHDLRHTYCSWLVQAGRPLEEVKVLAGHESVTTTERYAHFAPDHGLDAGSVLERRGKRPLGRPSGA